MKCLDTLVVGCRMGLYDVSDEKGADLVKVLRNRSEEDMGMLVT